MTPASPPSAVASRRTLALAAGYLLVAAVAVFPGARLWLQRPMRLIEFEFDWLLGLSPDPRVVLGARLAQVLLLLGAGALFVLLVRALARNPLALGLRGDLMLAGAVTLVFAVGMPWVSPDVFFYIGTGWLDAHYDLSPYLSSVADVPHSASEEMFQNMFPGFRGGITAYGAAFQLIASTVARLSGGHEKLALALWKGLALGGHALSTVAVHRLAPPARARLAAFAFAANPLVLFSLVTCVHNDFLLNAAVLWALVWWKQGRALGAGFLAGLAVTVKYVPLLLLPFLAIEALRRAEPLRARLRTIGLLVAGVATSVGLTVLSYPESVLIFARVVAAGGISLKRNSIYYLLAALEVLGVPIPHLPYPTLTLGVFAVAYAVLLGLAWRRRDAAAADLYVVALLLNFMITQPTVQEWYLAWLVPLALASTNDAFRRLAMRLSVLFVPFVIFTVKSPSWVLLVANTGLYLLVVACALPALRAFARTLRAKAPASAAPAAA